MQRFLEAVGAVNGVNQDFATSTPYVSGTLQVFRNGRLVSPDLGDGFDEIAPVAGTFRMKAAPRVGNVLFTFYEEV